MYLFPTGTFVPAGTLVPGPTGTFVPGTGMMKSTRKIVFF
jgi:hypothetical protein